MKPKDLSARISDLESLLNHFSIEELTMEEASYLKSTFNAFKKSLGNESLNSDKDKDKEGIRTQTKNEILPALEYLRDCSRLLGEGKLTQEQRAYINGMQQISHMLLAKVQGLSSTAVPISHISAKRGLDFNIHHLLRNVLFINKTLAVSPELKISIDIDSEVSEIQKGEPSLLSQMLLHLFGKAIRFMETGSISLRISMVGETKDTSNLEFGFVLNDDCSPSRNSKTLSQKHELQFTSFQKWMKKHNLRSEFIKVSEMEQQIKFVLPFQKSDRKTSISKDIYNNSDKLYPAPITQAPSFQTVNWDGLRLQCQGDLGMLEELLNRWQGQLLGFVGKAKIQLKNADFTGLEKSSFEIRNNLEGIPFQDIRTLLERMTRTCATDRDLEHLRFLFKSLLEEYGIMDRTIVSELKRMQREGGQ